MDKQALIDALVVWDGRQIRHLEEVQQRFFGPRPEVALLLDLLTERPELKIAITWLLKSGLEKGVLLSSDESERLLDLGMKLECWQSILHILQILGEIQISEAKRFQLETALRQWITHENKFIRAWCYNGWYVLAQQYPQYRDEVKLFFEMAQWDEVASVKARIRQLEKQGMWHSA